MNEILNREDISREITQILLSFDTECRNTNFKKGLYIYGSSGCGKTTFIMNLLKNMNYDIIRYDAGDVRNKMLIETITSNNISNRNVLQMMNRKEKKLIIVMDEIDGMNNGDKGGITSLIKLIRQKKTKKQKLENVTLNPIICIGNYYIDKKIKELMKVCNTFELKSPTPPQIVRLLHHFIPTMDLTSMSEIHRQNILNHVQGDIRKIAFVKKLYEGKSEILFSDNNLLMNVFQTKSYNEDAKHITKTLINSPFPMEKHNSVMNETDRTIVSLLYHENIIDAFGNSPNNKTFPFYLRILENMCFADYIDRITFQNQIWIFNEMSSLMKTFYSNALFHTEFPDSVGKFNPSEVRFTKILTKYSTEYNNQVFIYNLCQNMDMDKKDLIAYFQDTRLQIQENIRAIEERDSIIETIVPIRTKRVVESGENLSLVNVSKRSIATVKAVSMDLEVLSKVEKQLGNYSITRLDIKRIYRYLDKNVKKDTICMDDEDIYEED